MKVYVYEQEQVNRLLACLNSLQVSGIEQAKILVMASNIVETGKVRDISVENKNDMRAEEQQNESKIHHPKDGEKT